MLLFICFATVFLESVVLPKMYWKIKSIVCFLLITIQVSFCKFLTKQKCQMGFLFVIDFGQPTGIQLKE